MKLPVVEIFRSLQGEGRYVGVPSIFIRVNGCNLRCCFAGSICDTPYTSHHPETNTYNTVEEVRSEVAKILNSHQKTKHIVFTGGEPMMYQQAIAELIYSLDRDFSGLFITVETNGTIPMQPIMTKMVDFWSISPKLSTSCCFEGTEVPEKQREMHLKNRFNAESFASYIMSGQEGQLKFVWSCEGNTYEIKRWLEDVRNWVGENRGERWKNVFDQHMEEDFRVMLMPEGITNEQLNNKLQDIAEVCLREDWEMTDREHIRIWGDKRGV